MDVRIELKSESLLIVLATVAFFALLWFWLRALWPWLAAVLASQ